MEVGGNPWRGSLTVCGCESARRPWVRPRGARARSPHLLKNCSYGSDLRAHRGESEPPDDAVCKSELKVWMNPPTTLLASFYLESGGEESCRSTVFQRPRPLR